MGSSKNISEKSDVLGFIERVRNGEQRAFSELVERYAPLIESLVSKFYDGDVLGVSRDDLRQEAVLRFYNSILTYDIDQCDVEFGLYAKICISNALTSQLRLYRKRTAEQLADLYDIPNFVCDSEDPSDRILEEERVKALYSLIRKNLSPYEYRIWQMYMSGRTAKDIGIVVNSDEKSVSNAIYRIRKKLRALLV